jgi:Skp family chaperone for outer membrane proteins
MDTEKFDLILTEGVYFVSPRIDVTERVIRALNAPAPAK